MMDPRDKNYIEGPSLQKMANEMISDQMLEEACKEKVFRDFLKLCILTQHASVVSREPGEFGFIFIFNDHGEKVTVEMDIKLRVPKEQ